MNAQVIEMLGKSIFFFVVGVILASLFMWSMMQGVTLHMDGKDSVAF